MSNTLSDIFRLSSDLVRTSSSTWNNIITIPFHKLFLPQNAHNDGKNYNSADSIGNYCENYISFRIIACVELAFTTSFQLLFNWLKSIALRALQMEMEM